MNEPLCNCASARPNQDCTCNQISSPLSFVSASNTPDTARPTAASPSMLSNTSTPPTTRISDILQYSQTRRRDRRLARAADQFSRAALDDLAQLTQMMPGWERHAATPNGTTTTAITAVRRPGGACVGQVQTPDGSGSGSGSGSRQRRRNLEDQLEDQLEMQMDRQDSEAEQMVEAVSASITRDANGNVTDQVVVLREILRHLGGPTSSVSVSVTAARQQGGTRERQRQRQRQRQSGGPQYMMEIEMMLNPRQARRTGGSRSLTSMEERYGTSSR